MTQNIYILSHRTLVFSMITNDLLQARTHYGNHALTRKLIMNQARHLLYMILFVGEI